MKQINNWMGALIVAVAMLSSGTVFAKSVSIGILPQGSLAYGIAYSGVWAAILAGIALGGGLGARELIFCRRGAA